MSVPAAKHAAPNTPNTAIVQYDGWVRVQGIPFTLIAAAPDLLEVAQLFLVLDKTDVVSDKTYIEIMHDIAEKAELAVRRALGEDSK